MTYALKYFQTFSKLIWSCMTLLLKNVIQGLDTQRFGLNWVWNSLASSAMSQTANWTVWVFPEFSKPETKLKFGSVFNTRWWSWWQRQWWWGCVVRFALLIYVSCTYNSTWSQRDLFGMLWNIQGLSMDSTWTPPGLLVVEVVGSCLKTCTVWHITYQTCILT